MSFSSEVKEELAVMVSPARHCQLAELAAIVYLCGNVTCKKNKEVMIRLETENQAVVRKYFTLLKKAFMINTDMVKVLQAIRLYQEPDGVTSREEGIPSLLIKNSCCRRAYLRGVFLCIGSMSDPKKGYHLEFVCNHTKQAEQLREILKSFQLEAKVIFRKKYEVVYLKEGAGIADLLNIMGAHHSLMDLENLRIEKEVRNSVNRKVNCEAANITKTVAAASKQIEDIILLKERYGFENLPDNLREMAEVRLEYPGNSLKELGGYLNPPVGKSGVNHRLRKLSELADKLQAKGRFVKEERNG